MFTVITGSQFGDEGKGKIVDLLSKKYDIVARFQGGDNAGHTVVVGKDTYKLHQIPSGILVGARVLIGSGVVANPLSLLDEINMLKDRGVEVSRDNFGIDYKTSVIMPYHIALDSLSEKATSDKIGTTKKGIGFAYADKVSRNEIKMSDICGDMTSFKRKIDDIYPAKQEILKNGGIETADVLNDEKIKQIYACGQVLKQFLTDCSYEINQALKNDKNVLAEGAQGTHLDVVHGTQKYVTSSSTIAGSACTGLGVGPTKVSDVMAIVKAYITRVGAGPLPTELNDSDGKHLATAGHEYGTTTGRLRRCGWFDIPLLKKAVFLNGYTQIALTKTDVLTGLNPIRVCTGYNLNGDILDYPPIKTEDIEKCIPVYKDFEGWSEDITKAQKFEDLPPQAREYVLFLQEALGVPFTFISVGPERDQTFEMESKSVKSTKSERTKQSKETDQKQKSSFEETKSKVLAYAEKYAAKNNYILNPDRESLDLVIEGLAKRREQYGSQYCPCRIVTGDKEQDRKIICPCVYHKDEIEQDGMCHCALFFKKK